MYCMQAFEVAIGLARAVFDMGASLGLRDMHILDIGGGFTAQVWQTLLAPHKIQLVRRGGLLSVPALRTFLWHY